MKKIKTTYIAPNLKEFEMAPRSVLCDSVVIPDLNEVDGESLGINFI